MSCFPNFSLLIYVSENARNLQEQGDILHVFADLLSKPEIVRPAIRGLSNASDFEEGEGKLYSVFICSSLFLLIDVFCRRSPIDGLLF